MINPVSTYRIQFHKDFRLTDFSRIIPYLVRLGIRTIYASPIFEAVPGSMHGYDVTNPLRINPEIGTSKQLSAISKKLKQSGINWVQDIVPNHMAFHASNKWLMDVLEKGRASRYANVFDILWDSPVYDGKLMVPFLGKPVEEAIASGEIRFEWNGRPLLTYFGQQYPVSKNSLGKVLGSRQLKDGQRKEFAKKVSSSPELLKSLIDNQYYQLCFWQETDKKINFRRFFTVNGLICLNIQERPVFDLYHQLIAQLINDGVFQGLRVDHIDGLYDPEHYLQRLRELAGEDTYIIVEKILEKGEEFPPGWPVQGNTGYDYLSVVNNLFTNRDSKPLLSEFYKKLISLDQPVSLQILEKKRMILESSMQGELENLYRLFIDLSLADPEEIGGIAPEMIRKAITAILIHCPVYRFYGNTMPLAPNEADAFRQLLRTVSKHHPNLSGIQTVLQNALLFKSKIDDPGYRRRALQFYQRLMQFTGPLMAKGVEDTLMYSYNRFIDHNEVGDSPASFGIKLKAFHELMQDRQEKWPLSINATSTHDTKRGEDVRARLNVLSDMAREWIKEVTEWQKLNSHGQSGKLPDVNDQYFIYQTLVGTHPMPGEPDDNFEARLQEYLVKALREGKRNSNWANPDTDYEKAACEFASTLIDPKKSFSARFRNFHARVADFGIINSLSQVLLKYTCPGVPDLYQGCDLWDLSMVDPDNRRPVDYDLRLKLLQQERTWKELWAERHNGGIKMALINKLLLIRKNNADVFLEGFYIPLNVKGKYKNNVLAFCRQSAGSWYVTAIILHFAAIAGDASNFADFDWKDTDILLPPEAPVTWKNLLNNECGHSQGYFSAQNLFTEVPVAFLQLLHPKNKRSAGILMHVSSLPGGFGIGDIGPAAQDFADFLYHSRQSFWQMLPVNPIDKSAGYSPYSATSAMAGNTMLISPELLLNEGLLTPDEVSSNGLNKGPVDYAEVSSLKNSLFDLAYMRSLTNRYNHAFGEFKAAESWWLDDFALYQYLKEKFNDEPWYQWPAKFKFRNSQALKEIGSELSIDKIKWLQYVFAKQWQGLKNYCTSLGVRIIGDMPFYISYDSVDVWANPSLFKIDRNGKIKGIAGVPPDYFSTTGQLWGMPVYDWHALKRSGYSWWLNRITKNLQFFDLIRLDHFRAFAEYWEVPGGAANAIEGQWQTGPGEDFFKTALNEFGTLPFIAEDLGQIDDRVYELRDRFSLPGMRILQFAFDKTCAVSDYMPHNYNVNSFVYTGTHDNNTIRGWYEDEIDQDTKSRIAHFAGVEVSAKNIHEVLIRMSYASVAKTAMIPMQDLLGLDGSARINVPSSAEGNWLWRLTPGALTRELAGYLAGLCLSYNR